MQGYFPCLLISSLRATIYKYKQVTLYEYFKSIKPLFVLFLNCLLKDYSVPRKLLGALEVPHQNYVPRALDHSLVADSLAKGLRHRILATCMTGADKKNDQGLFSTF